MEGTTRTGAVARWVGVALALSWPGTATGQEPGDPQRLSLERVVARALQHSPDVQIAQSRRETAAGAWRRAGGPFDLHSRLSISGRSDETFEIAPDFGGIAETAVVSKELAQRVTFQKLWRSGIQVQPSIAIVRNESTKIKGLPPNRTLASLTLTVPLLQGRTGGLLTAGEHAAGEMYQASRHEEQHSAAAVVLEAVTSYWAYRSAAERLEVQSESEARAVRLVEETRRLIEADERAAADIYLPLSSLASKRAGRVLAEQQVIEARARLGLAMGWAAEEIQSIPLPGTPFPELPPEHVPYDAQSVARLVERALDRRQDLAGSRRREQGSLAVHTAAQRELKPRLDLVFGGGYSGIERGDGVSRLYSSVYRHVPGWNTSFDIALSLPRAGSAAQGAALEAEASFERSRIERAELARRIASGVRVAALALDSGDAEHRAADEAVRHSQATLDSETRRFRLGMSTLFNTIQAEDNLTNTLLSRISTRQRYAVALVRLRFETGTLVAGQAVDLEGILNPAAGREPSR